MAPARQPLHYQSRDLKTEVEPLFVHLESLASDFLDNLCCMPRNAAQKQRGVHIVLRTFLKTTIKYSTEDHSSTVPSSKNETCISLRMFSATIDRCN
jgi:hypothetical protein